MKKVNLLCAFLMLPLLFSYIFAQNNQHDSGISDEVFNQLEQVIKTHYGTSFELHDVINPDSLYLGKFSLLNGKLVFGVHGDTSTFIGIATGSQIIWTSPTEMDISLYPSIYQIIDLNNDGNPEILVMCEGSSGYVELWLYSWNGSVGTRINPLNSTLIGFSAIGSFDLPEAVQFVDTNGDGIKEIRALTLDNIALYFYWNGSQYIEGTPSPLIVLPRDRLSIVFTTKIEKSGNDIHYKYFIRNDASSIQSADDLLLEPAGGLNITGITGRSSWKPASGPSFVRWTNLFWYGDNNFISPGETDANFSILRGGLPVIAKYYVQGHNGDEFSGSGIITNSACGYTVCPFDSPIPFVTSNFLDTLSSGTTQSRTLGWIKDQPTANKYLSYFASAKTSLGQNNITSTRTTLQKVLTDVNIDSTANLTSEAYALIRYNTEYLLAQLPIPPPGCIVKLINSTGTKLIGGALQYYDGAWKDAVNNNDGTFFVNTTKTSLSLRMTYEYGTQTKSNVAVSYDTVAFQTIKAQIQLQNSGGALIDTGSVQYYAGAWRILGPTTNGIAAKELLPASYSFRIKYSYASKDKQQDIGANATVIFQTVNAAVQLQNSQGALIDQGTVQYYSGAWRNIGTTTNGVATKELLPNNYSFRMTYAYASKDKQQDLSTNSTVIFQTVNAAVQLQNSLGALMPAPSGDQGTVQYYSGAWRDLGTTTNGVANKELLPNNYSFRMTYAYASKDKQQDLSTNPIVVFQTVNTAVQLKNSLGNLIPAPSGDQGTVQYYSGAWRSLGTTTNGIATKELLPNTYSFRMTYEYVSVDKSQDLSVNSTVSFLTVLCTIRVKNSQNQLVDGALASYYSGAWRQIGNTINGVITKELLPMNLSFRVKYGTQQQDKQQNLSTNTVVEFGIQ
jgi:hypothetical protein